MKFQYGQLDITVRYAGEGAAPWDPDESPRHEYAIVATRGKTRYSTKGWGSIRDFEEGEPEKPEALRDMAWTVIDDLASAASDPDEWITLVIGELGGREALARGKVAEQVIAAAERIGHDAIFEAAEVRRAEEEKV